MLPAGAYYDFKPYVGIDVGLNIVDYNVNLDMEDVYYSGTLNAGARIGNNFGMELFYGHSSKNNLEYVSDDFVQEHEFYYMMFGFDIMGYYPISKYFDFFTSFGVVNYKSYNKYEIITPCENIEEKQSDNDVSTRLGIGGMYTLPEDNISVIIQYQYTPINGKFIGNMSEFSIGFRYNF